MIRHPGSIANIMTHSLVRHGYLGVEVTEVNTFMDPHTTHDILEIRFLMFGRRCAVRYLNNYEDYLNGENVVRDISAMVRDSLDKDLNYQALKTLET